MQNSYTIDSRSLQDQWQRAIELAMANKPAPYELEHEELNHIAGIRTKSGIQAGAIVWGSHTCIHTPC